MTARNRGKQPNDDKWFGPRWHPVFKQAVDDLCYLYTRGYAENSAIQVVGDRYKLNKRQRKAIVRISCSDQQVAKRAEATCEADSLKNKVIEIDGFNLLILMESLLSGAYIFKGRDGLYRDISSVHGSYKRVVKTENAIVLVGDTLKALEIRSVKWYFDRPVSNSGRLKIKLLEIAEKNQFNWEVELVTDPDKILAASSAVVITSDGWILDRVPKWFNFASHLLKNQPDNPNIVEV